MSRAFSFDDRQKFSLAKNTYQRSVAQKSQQTNRKRTSKAVAIGKDENNSNKSGPAAAGPTPPNDKQPKIKDVLNTLGYRLIRKLGEGTYSEVKMAFSKTHSCNVAIKIMPKQRMNKEFKNEFLPRELEVVRTLTHRNIISFYHLIETKRIIYIVMECAEHGDLIDVIEQTEIPECIARLWFRDLMEGIEYMHRHGIAHRDLKLENLLLDKANTLKISDFGYVHVACKENIRKLSETYCGSIAYAPPEILFGQPYDPFMGDLWNAGIILFTMVYRDLPFDDSDPAKLLVQVKEPVQFPVKEMSDACKTLITRMLVEVRQRLRIPEIKCDPWYTGEVCDIKGYNKFPFKPDPEALSGVIDPRSKVPFISVELQDIEEKDDNEISTSVGEKSDDHFDLTPHVNKANNNHGALAEKVVQSQIILKHVGTIPPYHDMVMQVMNLVQSTIGMTREEIQRILKMQYPDTTDDPLLLKRKVRKSLGLNLARRLIYYTRNDNTGSVRFHTNRQKRRMSEIYRSQGVQKKRVCHSADKVVTNKSTSKNTQKTATSKAKVAVSSRTSTPCQLAKV